MRPSSKNLIWIDLEMTGLNQEKDRIIEIATVVTDTNLEVLAEGPVFAIHQMEHILSSMDEWNTKHHNASGLVDRIRASTIKEQEAEAETIEFLMHHIPCGKSPMCGNTVYQDRKFLHRYMPKLEQYFHYRNLDVSSLKILAKLWNPEIIHDFKKKSKHIALQDIHDSIAELKHYREHFLRVTSN
jgi:oligoribonuclease